MKYTDLTLVPTPDAWLQAASKQIDLLLIDHANCEKKAASTALNLMYRYVDDSELLLKLSALAREELRHFEQVVAIMDARRIPYVQLSSARYAVEMRKLVRSHEPARLVDLMIVSGVVEARSCERFERLITVLDGELASFYRSLWRSEARHCGDYLTFAEARDPGGFAAKLTEVLACDEALITSEDDDFRFHSGIPRCSAGLSTTV
jgi:tRNA-(ms[2]io[6]A)-hydroxylase